MKIISTLAMSMDRSAVDASQLINEDFIYSATFTTSSGNSNQHQPTNSGTIKVESNAIALAMLSAEQAGVSVETLTELGQEFRTKLLEIMEKTTLQIPEMSAIQLSAEEKVTNWKCNSDPSP